MNTNAKPKQFLELHGKPIIIYTLEHFEKHHEIDNIVVVCIESWISELEHLLEQYHFEKVRQIVPGGEGGDKSIYKGLLALEDTNCAPDDIILIHDGVRPLINNELISKNIKAALEYGVAITIDNATESIVRLNEDGIISEVPPRADMYMAKAPQSFKYKIVLDLYKRAQLDGHRTVDSAHLCNIYGVEMHTIRSTPNNIKITSPTDYYIFRALFEIRENEQILGM
jgi:2-C-methyl-D-erythritol 4-phosphate cytidylyltransferase